MTAVCARLLEPGEWAGRRTVFEQTNENDVCGEQKMQEVVMDAEKTISAMALEALKRIEAAVGKRAEEISGEQLLGAIPAPGGALALGDDDYPYALRTLADPPEVIAWTGDLTLLERELSVSIVGSRDATPERCAAAKALARNLAERGALIVSGLAAGIDRAAHEGALDARSGDRAGRTVAVLGTPLKSIWPPMNVELGARIAKEGLLLSEVAQLAALGAKDDERAIALKRRNRIVAALGLGSVVMAARKGSSTLIEARASLAIGHPVLIWHEAAGDDWAREWIAENPKNDEGGALIHVVASAADVEAALSPWRRVWWL